MRNSQYIVVLMLLLQACAVTDGYRDNQHSAYARQLTAKDKALVDSGSTIEMSTANGKLLAMKGDPKVGKYNFIEIGEWKEQFEYSSGNFIKGNAEVATTYDMHGNIRESVSKDKSKNATEYYTQEIWTSQMVVINNDSLLSQNIKVFNRAQKQVHEFNLIVVNHKENLSDRLKSKLKVGTWKDFDDNGILKTETVYKYEDKVKAN